MEFEFDENIIFILFFVAILFLFGIYGVIQDTATAQTAKEACILSIQTKVFLDDSTYGFHPYDVTCPRRIISIIDDKANVFSADMHDKNTKTTQYTYQIRTDSGITVRSINEDEYEQDVHEAIAYEMTECWDRFDQGSRDVFEPWGPDILSRPVCLICSEFHMQDSQQVVIDERRVLDLNHHLLTDIARRYPTVDDYLYGVPSPANPYICLQDHLSVDEITLSDDNPLAVVYYRHPTSCQAVTAISIKEIPERCRVVG